MRIDMKIRHIEMVEDALRGGDLSIYAIIDKLKHQKTKTSNQGNKRKRIPTIMQISQMLGKSKQFRKKDDLWSLVIIK